LIEAARGSTFYLTGHSTCFIPCNRATFGMVRANTVLTSAAVASWINCLGCGDLSPIAQVGGGFSARLCLRAFIYCRAKCG